MKIKIYIFFLACILAVSFLDNAYSAVSKGDTTKVLFVSESHGQGGDSVTWKSSQDFIAKKLNAVYQMGNLGLTQTTFASASQALDTVNSNLFNISSYTSAMASYLRDNNYSNGKVDWYYTFTDTSDNEQKKIYLPLSIYPDGSVKNLGARIITASPKILYYIYRSKGTEDALPAGWSYPDGGILYKYVLDTSFNAISSSTVDTGGRYDPPLTPEGDSAINPNTGLELMIAEVVKPEMENKGAIFSIVDYARRVSPVYDCDDQGNCLARVSVESLSRIARSYCGGGYKYSNTGRTGYTLSYAVERYFVDESGNYTMVASSTGYSVSTQQKDFSYSIVTPNKPDYYDIINPINGDIIYRFNNDTVNSLPCDRYIYAGTPCAQSPINTNTNMACTPSETHWFERMYIFRSLYLAYMRIKAVCNANGQSWDWYTDTKEVVCCNEYGDYYWEVYEYTFTANTPLYLPSLTYVGGETNPAAQDNLLNSLYVHTIANYSSLDYYLDMYDVYGGIWKSYGVIFSLSTCEW